MALAALFIYTGVLDAPTLAKVKTYNVAKSGV